MGRTDALQHACPQFVVMDSGFYSGEFLDLLRWWGFEHIRVGGRSNLKLRDGRTLNHARKGEQVEPDSAPGRSLFVSWVDLPRDGKTKRFSVLDTLPGTARTLTRRHKRRWLIESFFKSAKHDFGLKETRLRSETGIKNWLLLVMLSASLALTGAGEGTPLCGMDAQAALLLDENSAPGHASPLGQNGPPVGACPLFRLCGN